MNQANTTSTQPERPLVDIETLISEYHSRKPDLDDSQQLVSFGTSGHRGTSLNGTFNERHIHAITQAICDYRGQQGIDGPLYLGKDTHCLSGPAQDSALEVLAANKVDTVIQKDNGYTPTPVISRQIIVHNRARKSGLADGVVITPSHNPPGDGGFKYNATNGGPADAEATTWIQDRANALLQSDEVKSVPVAAALEAASTHQQDFVRPYVDDLRNVIDFDCIRSAGLKIGVDPLGGAAVNYWEPIAETYGIELTVVNSAVDPQFAFMPVDHDGKIRMDCSSRFAMANLIALKDKYDIAFGNDPDADRHGIVAPSVGLLNPNHFLAVAIRYLLENRADWPSEAAIGKTLVSSAIIERVAASLGRKVYEVPVGFKWYADGLFRGQIVFGGEESAGASFLQTDGNVWTTDKDGIILGLLAAEITARTGQDPGEHFQQIAEKHGTPHYTRIDEPANPAQKTALKQLQPEAVTAEELAGEPILQKLTHAPGNGAAIGGLKVVTSNGWFAARPSGTEDLYKIYAESFRDQGHLEQLIEGARAIVSRAFEGTS
jgi:phosphoglucomutase